MIRRITTRRRSTARSALCSLLAITATFTPITAQASGRISGTISSPAHITLPPHAVVLVTLRDVSLADAPAEEISSLELRPKHPPPLHFTLSYDSRRIHPAHTYAVSARILVDRRLAFISTRMYPVLTRGAPRTVKLVVDPVGARPD